MEWVLALLSFFTVTVTGLAVGQLWKREEAEVRVRLQRMLVSGRAHSYGELELGTSLPYRVIRPLLGQLAQVVGRLAPPAVLDRVRKRMMMAGYPGGQLAHEFFTIKLLLGGGLPVLTFLLTVGQDPSRAVLLAVVAGLAGFILPDATLNRRIQERQKQVGRSLPDVLDLLTVSVEAGLGFDAAIGRVGEEIKGPLGEELHRVLHEIRMGKPRRSALRDMAARVQVEDLTTFVGALVQADKLGISIGKVLRVQSAEIRRKRRQKAEEAAMKAPIKMLFPLVLFVFPALFITLLGPAAIQIMRTFSGGGL